MRDSESLSDFNSSRNDFEKGYSLSNHCADEVELLRDFFDGIKNTFVVINLLNEYNWIRNHHLIKVFLSPLSPHFGVTWVYTSVYDSKGTKD